MPQLSAPIWIGIGVAVAVIVAVVVLATRRRGAPRVVSVTEEIPSSLKLPINTLKVGNYRILDLLSESQYAMTYRGKAADGALCIIKLPSRLCLADHDNLKRFGREGQLLELLQHPNIIKKLDAGEISDQGLKIPYLVLEYHEGKDLGDILAERAPLPVPEAVGMISQVASALDVMHAKGVVHRNLSPDAIRVSNDGQVIVHNFGVARALTMETITLHGQIVGTVEYIAPEQIYGKQIDGRADLYALGVLGYRMLTGRSPFIYASIAALVKQKNESDGPHPRESNADIPNDLDRIVSLLMSRDPARRPHPAGMLTTQLAEIGQ